MALPLGTFRLRAVPNWLYPPLEVGGIYATYNQPPEIIVGAEVPGLMEHQVWEVMPSGPPGTDEVMIRAVLLGNDKQFMHNMGVQQNEPVVLGPMKPFKLERNRDIHDRIICLIIPIDAPPREVGAIHCIGTDGNMVVTKVVAVDGQTDCPGWEFVETQHP
ncbi:hypothetical protein OPQ81_011085 [Rhizoctonia solani]|nr:hypothetical protein OPQ81_011085 [Rhizoctonia solani]